MRHCILSLFVFYITSTLCLFSQNKELSDLQGLKDNNGIEYYECAGYNISISKIYTTLNGKDIARIKKKYKLKNITREYTSIDISYPHKIIYSQDKLANYSTVSTHSLLYIITKEGEERKSDLIYFEKLGNRDTKVEEQFLNLYLKNNLSEYVVSNNIDSVNFVGRKLHLGNICYWHLPHNIYCNGGQISWSIFGTHDQAKDEISNYIQSKESEYLISIEDKEIPLLFEGNKVIARRIVYKSTYHEEGFPLIVYYVATKVRDKYISCILSHYGYNRNDYELPDLLKEIIQFEELPESASNKYDIPEKDKLNSEQKEKIKNLTQERKLRNLAFSIKSGVYIPLGNQREILGNSPFIELEMNLGGLYNFRSGGLLINFGFVMPNDRKWFDFKNNNEIIRAKAHSRVYVNAGYKYTCELKRFFYWDNFLKLGVNSTFTNKKKPEKNDDGTHSAYSAAVFNMSIGTQIRYKQVGLHLEYQYSPYNKSKYLEVGGNSALLTGLSFSL